MTVAGFIALAEESLKGVYDKRERENVINLVVEEVLHISRHKLKFHMLNSCNSDTEHKLRAFVSRLAENEPVQYVLGFTDFYELKLKVNKHVLIPRPETEELVGYAIKELLPLTKTKVLSILDIGTGSGCIAITLRKHLAKCEVTGIDVSADAILVAKENAKNVQCDVKFIKSDFLDETTWKDYESFDTIVSNPPYVTPDEFSEMMPRVKDFEPHMALMANNHDPFIFYRKIAKFSKSHLKAGGCIFLEMNGMHFREIESIFKAESFNPKISKDLQGTERILVIRK